MRVGEQPTRIIDSDRGEYVATLMVRDPRNRRFLRCLGPRVAAKHQADVSDSIVRKPHFGEHASFRASVANARDA